MSENIKSDEQWDAENEDVLLEQVAELCIYCNEHPVDHDHDPYCSSECGVLAELEGE